MELNRVFQAENVESQAHSQDVELTNRNPPIIGDLARTSLKEHPGEYGEYFMPVNQHKKSFRGEKLYVTKDGRKTSGCCRLWWWIIALLLLVAAIIVAVLIGTGIIDPNRSRTSVGTGGDHSDRNYHYEPNKFVPNVFNGELKIMNMNWTDDLGDPNSEMYKTMSEDLEIVLANASSYLDSSNSLLNVKVTEFLPGSIIVKFKIGKELDDKEIKQSELSKILFKILKNENTSKLEKYEISPRSVLLDPVPDNCSSLSCSEGCQYNYTQLAFECTCPDDLVLVNDVECQDDMDTMDHKVDHNSDNTDNDSMIIKIKESIKLINKTIRNISPGSIKNEDRESMKQIKKVFGREILNLNKSIQVIGKPISLGTSTKTLNLVDLPESARVQEEVVNKKFEDRNMVEQGTTSTGPHLGLKESINRRKVTIIPEPQQMSYQQLAAKEFSKDASVHVELVSAATTNSTSNIDLVNDLTTNQINHLKTREYSKLNKITPGREYSKIESTTENILSASLHYVTKDNNVNIIPPSALEQTSREESHQIDTEKEDLSTKVDLSTTKFNKEPKEAGDHKYPTTQSLNQNERISINKYPKSEASYDIIGDPRIPMIKRPNEDPQKKASDVLTIGLQTLVDDDGQIGYRNSTEYSMDNITENERQITNPSEYNADVKEETSQKNALTLSILNILNSPGMTGLTNNESTPVKVEDSNWFTISIILNNTLSHHYTESSTSISQDIETIRVDNIFQREQNSDPAQSITQTEGNLDQKNNSVITNIGNTSVMLKESKFKDEKKPEKKHQDATTSESIDTITKVPINLHSDRSGDSETLTTQSYIGTSLKDLLNMQIEATSEIRDVSEDDLNTERKAVTSNSFLHTPAISTTLHASNTTSLFTEIDLSCLTGLVCAGVCLERHQVCDSLHDCPDGEDEALCSFPQCLEGEFQCLKGRCIPFTWTCDGKPDCQAEEDEVACSSSCSAGEMLCKEGRCIPERFLCDGIADCGQGEDEEKCECGSNEKRCELGGGCVELGKVCDGQVDCLDRSDEWNCLSLDNSTLNIRSESDNKWSPVCFESWDNSWSNGACRQLGFAEEALTQFNVENDIIDSQFWFRDTTLSFKNQPIQAARSSAGNEKCPSRAKVELTCKSFGCGRWNLQENPKSIGEQLGNTSIEWPSLALLFNVRSKTTCTLTIFSPVWLIASYSCVSEKSLDPQEWVVFGGTPGSSPLGHGATQIKMVKNLVAHPHARQGPQLMDHDYLLVELIQPLSLDSQVQAACLASEGIEQVQSCLSAGWVRSQTAGVSFIQYMSYLPQPNVSHIECNSWRNYNGQVTSSMICAQSAENATSHHDDGSPLMCLSKSGSWHLYGLLASKQVTTSSKQRPLVFSSILSVRRWIDRTVGTSF